MKMAIVVVVLSLVLAGSVFAVVDPDPNKMGLYFDENADLIDVYSYEFTPAYLVVTNPAFDAIKGLECYLDWDESVCAFQGLELPAAGFNLGDHHNVVIGLAAPLATTEATVMATYTLFSTGMTYFTLAAAEVPSIEGDLPVVIDGEDNIFQLGLAFGSGNVCAILNSPPDPVLGETWGGVKSLYR